MAQSPAQRPPGDGAGAKSSAADAAKSGTVPAQSPPTWRDVWQLPAMVVAVTLLGAAIFTLASRRPKPDITALMNEAVTMIEDQRFEAALDQLNGKVLPYFDKPAMTADQRREFHVLVARTIYLWQQNAPVKREENYQNVVGEYEEAERRHATLSPSDSYYYADSLVQVGRMDDALARVRRFREVKPEQKFAMLQRIVEMSREGGKADKVKTAELLADILSEADLPRDMRVWATARQAEAMLETGSEEEAVSRLLRVLPRLQATGSEGLGELYLALGEAYLRTGETKEAEKQFERAAEVLDEASPEMGRAQLMLGRMADLAKDYETAKERYDLVEERFGGTPVATAALLGLGEVEAARGEYDASVANLTAAVQEIKGGVKTADATPEMVTRTLESLAQERANNEDWENALRYASLAETLLGTDEAPSTLLKQLGEIHQKLAEEASAPLAKPADAGGSGALAQRHYMNAGNYFRAHANRMILTPGKEYADSLWSAADAFDRAGDRESAITAFEEFDGAFPDEPRRPESLFRLARAHQARGELQKAAELYLGLIGSRGPGGAGRFADDSYVPLAQTYLMDNDRGNDEQAEELLENVIAGGLGGPQTVNYRDALVVLGEHLYDNARQPEKTAGDKGSIRDTLALFARAIERLEEAQTRFPALPRLSEVRFKLADACRLSAAVMEDKLKEAMPDADRRALEQARAERLNRATSLYEEVRRSLEAKAPRSRNGIEELYLRNSYFYLGDCAFSLQDYDGAIRAYDAARERYGGEAASLVAMVQIVNAYMRQGDTRRAAAANEHARRFFASLPESVWEDPNLPMTRRDWERWLDATADLTRASRADGTDKSGG